MKNVAVETHVVGFGARVEERIGAKELPPEFVDTYTISQRFNFGLEEPASFDFIQIYVAQQCMLSHSSRPVFDRIPLGILTTGNYEEQNKCVLID